jgi:hypothetical protein
MISRNSGMSSRILLLGCIVGLAVYLAPSAGASELIDRNASQIRLAVDNKGVALLTYKANRKLKHVLVRGAINALPPVEGGRQVKFKIDYAGGWGFYHKLKYWKKFRNACIPYDGPSLPWIIKACLAPDGSYWVVQKWQRMLPNYGMTPTKRSQRAWEMRLSHWNTDLPVLDIYLDWAYHEHFDHLFGTFTYAGAGVYGFANTPSGNPLDSWGRNIYVDTFNSAYGPGWKRENSFLTHEPTGGFCYVFVEHKFNGKTYPIGNGTKYRATVVGPGVMPDISWQGSPVPFDETLSEEAAAKRAEILGDDPRCTEY